MLCTLCMLDAKNSSISIRKTTFTEGLVLRGSAGGDASPGTMLRRLTVHAHNPASIAPPRYFNSAKVHKTALLAPC